MTDIKIFDNPEFGSIRSVDIEGEPWFVAADICQALDISNPSVAVSRLDFDERAKFNLGRQGATNVVSEYGLYNLILASRKPEARAFKRWITHEVLPAIRKRGGYMVAHTDETPEQTLARAVLIAQDTIARKDARIAELEPQARFGALLTQSATDILVRDLAKLITQQGHTIGERRLFDWLRDNGYLICANSRDRNHPKQRYMEQGLFNVKANTFTNNRGELKTTYTPLVTPKGQEYFLEKFLGMEVLS